MQKITVSSNEAGQRLDKLLGKYLSNAPMSFVYKMLRKKNIKLNGKKAQGVTFWVKNLSDYEVSLGLEIDEYDPGAKAGDNGERWSLQYGTRVLLYDVNTKQQYIVQSQPHLFIPVGFTGWVRVPFSFYTKAPWCTWGNDVQDFLDVPQIAVISDSNINQGLSFAIDNLGVYYEETLVSTEFFSSGMSLPERMGIK